MRDSVRIAWRGTRYGAFLGLSMALAGESVAQQPGRLPSVAAQDRRPAAALAICKDGTTAAVRSAGTCEGHGGVSRVLEATRGADAPRGAVLSRCNDGTTVAFEERSKCGLRGGVAFSYLRPTSLPKNDSTPPGKVKSSERPPLAPSQRTADTRRPSS